MALVAKWRVACAADCGRTIDPGEVMERCTDGRWVHMVCDPTFVDWWLGLATNAPFAGWPDAA